MFLFNERTFRRYSASFLKAWHVSIYAYDIDMALIQLFFLISSHFLNRITTIRINVE